jgi:hypothetical protein
VLDEAMQVLLPSVWCVPEAAHGGGLSGGRKTNVQLNLGPPRRQSVQASIQAKEMTMNKQRTRLAGILAGAAALVVAGGGTTALANRDHPEDGPHQGQAGQVSAVVKHYDGTVLSKNRDARTFKMRTESDRTLKFRVTGTTEFERISGFGGLSRDLRIEVNAKRTDNGLLALKVETQGGGGGGSGGDDSPGDDHGSGGHGADDGANHS